MRQSDKAMAGIKEAENQNRRFWDEVAPVHFKSYGLDSLRRGVSRIDEIERREIYPVAGKELLHLQCHIGSDTLSLELDGAKVTGVDFSKESLRLAESLRDEMRLKAEFIHAHIFELRNILHKKFDIVYTSKGVLCWISDIREWARTISHFLKPDGFFYILESHPLMHLFDDTVENQLDVKYSYFHKKGPTVFDAGFPDYSDGSYFPKNHTCEWTWSLSDIINALIAAGLQIEFFNEHDRLFYSGLPGMVETEDGWFHLEKYKGMIPYTFSLKATVGSPTQN